MAILSEAKPSARWALDFRARSVRRGRRFRILNIVDDVDARMPGGDPGNLDLRQARRARADDLTSRRGKPGMIVSDNGTEFTSE